MQNELLDGEKIIVENPDLLQPLSPTTKMKEWLINHVGEKENPENGEVNIEMIIKVMAEEFPEFLIDCGITSISVTPDTAMAVRISIEKAEKKLLN